MVKATKREIKWGFFCCFSEKKRESKAPVLASDRLFTPLDPLRGLGIFYLKVKNDTLLLNTKLLFRYQMNLSHLDKTRSFHFWLVWSMHFAEVSPYQISISVVFAAPVSTGKLVTIQY